MYIPNFVSASCDSIRVNVCDQSVSAWFNIVSKLFAFEISCSFGPVIIADKFAKLPLDIVELNPLNKLEYELIIDSLPTRLDKSSVTKSVTVPTAPPLPPPPQAVSVNADAVAKNAFLNFLLIILKVCL